MARAAANPFSSKVARDQRRGSLPQTAGEGIAPGTAAISSPAHRRGSSAAEHGPASMTAPPKTAASALVAMQIDVDKFWEVTLGTYARVAGAMEG